MKIHLIGEIAELEQGIEFLRESSSLVYVRMDFQLKWSNSG